MKTIQQVTAEAQHLAFEPEKGVEFWIPAAMVAARAAAPMIAKHLAGHAAVSGAVFGAKKILSNKSLKTRARRRLKKAPKAVQQAAHIAHTGAEIAVDPLKAKGLSFEDQIAMDWAALSADGWHDPGCLPASGTRRPYARTTRTHSNYSKGSISFEEATELTQGVALGLGRSIMAAPWHAAASVVRGAGNVGSVITSPVRGAGNVLKALPGTGVAGHAVHAIGSIPHYGSRLMGGQLNTVGHAIKSPDYIKSAIGGALKKRKARKRRKKAFAPVSPAPVAVSFEEATAITQGYALSVGAAAMVAAKLAKPIAAMVLKKPSVMRRVASKAAKLAKNRKVIAGAIAGGVVAHKVNKINKELSFAEATGYAQALAMNPKIAAQFRSGRIGDFHGPLQSELHPRKPPKQWRVTTTPGQNSPENVKKRKKEKWKKVAQGFQIMNSALH